MLIINYYIMIIWFNKVLVDHLFYSGKNCDIHDPESCRTKKERRTF